jgi:beta-glucosidase
MYYSYDPSRTHKYVDDDGKPLFPFGWGLSYTTFRYDRIAAVASGEGPGLKVHVTVDVRNTGPRDGEEVVQLYLRRDFSSVETPERELKGFARVSIKAGETRSVPFELTPHDLQVWNTEGKWVVEPGNYSLWAGDSSEAALKTTFKVQ